MYTRLLALVAATQRPASSIFIGCLHSGAVRKRRAVRFSRLSRERINSVARFHRLTSRAYLSARFLTVDGLAARFHRVRDEDRDLMKGSFDRWVQSRCLFPRLLRTKGARARGSIRRERSLKTEARSFSEQCSGQSARDHLSRRNLCLTSHSTADDLLHPSLLPESLHLLEFRHGRREATKPRIHSRVINADAFVSRILRTAGDAEYTLRRGL